MRDMKDKKDVLKNLTSVQYYVTQENGTERPYQNEFWDFHGEGIYVDVVSGEVLFSSKDKFDSSCGWPSFSKAVEGSILEQEDSSHGMSRVEVRSKQGDSHLGHVFQDGPKNLGGYRYCINSAALKFIPINKMKEQGYEEYMILFG
ncbi:MAG: peptide-methionine (R)-S-oxide reductase MsrB [Eubacteriales bacterium]